MTKKTLAETNSEAAALYRTTMYQLSRDVVELERRLAEHVQEHDGVIEDEHLLAEFEMLEGNMTEKMGRCLIVLDEMAHWPDRIGVEIKRLQEMKKAANDRVARFKDYLARCMKLSGREKIESFPFQARIQRNPPRVLVLDEAMVPDEYCDVSIRVDAERFAKIVALIREHDPGLLDPYTEIDRTVRRQDVIAAWKQAREGGSELEIPGCAVTQNESLRVS